MSRHTTFCIGGPADLYLVPLTMEAFASSIELCNQYGVPWFLLGAGANILVGDRGIRGAVIDTSALADISVNETDLANGTACTAETVREPQVCLHAQTGVRIDTLAEEALIHGLDGLAHFYGMPGSVGGAIFMNARCYEHDIAEHLTAAAIIRPDGRIEYINPSDYAWSYKRSPFQDGGPLHGCALASASFQLPRGDRLMIAKTMREKLADRRVKHHFDYPSAGSVFKNNRSFGKPTGKLLDELGLRGRRIGNAAVSPWHANIFVNLGGATAREMRALIESTEELVFRSTGWQLEREVLFLGEF
ncbi:MAG: UDP-N-acetylmuramate dehydrogenase [Spirochaetales bacterium]|nr:UDP-N-acetylmuramate dehydrogenase [Spirochaetales bacterium]